MDFRPRRSVLYMPSSNERALEKAKTIPCDGLILDLEDAVAPSRKPEARKMLAGMIAPSPGRPWSCWVRINPFDSGLTLEGARHYFEPPEPDAKHAPDVERLMDTILAWIRARFEL